MFDQSPRKILVEAPIKLNLALHVVGQRADGYHLLESLVTFIEAGDSISVEAASIDGFSIDGPYSQDLAVNDNNLVIRARDVLRNHIAQPSPPVFIHLEKKIPIASGVGGGSGDAAACLVALAALWQLDLDEKTLMALALRLGADVPMCLHAIFHKSALVARGVGETVEAIVSCPSLPVVLVNSGMAVSTPEVFSRLTVRNNPPLMLNATNIDTASKLLNFLDTTRNDLFPPALELVPELITVLAKLGDMGALFSRMSGSGATCFGVFPHVQAAEAAMQVLKTAYPSWFIMAGQTVGS